MGLPIHITEADGRHRVMAGDVVLGETGRALIVDEAGHNPTVYVPRTDMNMDLLEATPRHTTCPWKGQASYFSVKGMTGMDNVVWSYETPSHGVAPIAGHLAFYPQIKVIKV